MSTITVYTKEELESAKNNGYDEIIVEGDLASKLHKTKVLAKASKYVIGLIVALAATATATAPFTGGASFVVGAAAAAPVAAAAGTSTATIIIAVSLGIALILAVFKEYDEIVFEANPPKLVLKRKSTREA